MKCLIVQPIHEHGLEALKRSGIDPVICPDPTMETAASLVRDCEAVITRNAGFSATAFAAAENLKTVVVHGAGYDPVDMKSATEKGVLVCNTPGQNAQSVAEMALGLAFAAARLIPAADRDERAGLSGFRERNRTVELHGKNALIVGWGHIGSRLGLMLRQALAMRVLVHSPRVRDLKDFERTQSLEDGLAQADLVSLHTPLRAETRDLLGEKAFMAVKKGAIVVNTARAGLVDETALARALADERVFSAGLDVYSGTAPLGPLAETGRVVFTPHLGGSTEDSLSRTACAAASTVIRVLAGERPATALNEV